MQAQTSTRKRTALVTGASNGIGAAIALELANDGFDLALSATRVENLAAVIPKVEAVGARAVPLTLDLRSLSSIERVTDAAIEAFGQLDVVVNNAAMPFRKAAFDITLEDWNAVIETNVTGAFFLCQRIGRHHRTNAASRRWSNRLRGARDRTEIIEEPQWSVDHSVHAVRCK
jgi:NAD(P)-dependent dehydrogenase (short-subunit alcohol dehydrogenase family)